MKYRLAIISLVVLAMPPLMGGAVLVLSKIMSAIATVVLILIVREIWEIAVNKTKSDPWDEDP